MGALHQRQYSPRSSEGTIPSSSRHEALTDLVPSRALHHQAGWSRLLSGYSYWSHGCTHRMGRLPYRLAQSAALQRPRPQDFKLTPFVTIEMDPTPRWHRTETG